jgi:hypothetical protein
MLLRQISIFLLSSLVLWADIDLSFQEEESEFKPRQIISIELGGGSIQRLQADTISGTSIDRSLSFAGIKLGAEDIGLRLFLSYRPMDIEGIFTHSFGLELDSMVDISSSVRFFYGLVGGVVMYEIIDRNQTTDYTKESTPYYGVESGFIYALSESFELELGVRYALTNINDKTADKSYMFDQFFIYNLALNYKY